MQQLQAIANKWNAKQKHDNPFSKAARPLLEAENDEKYNIDNDNGVPTPGLADMRATGMMKSTLCSIIVAPSLRTSQGSVV